MELTGQMTDYGKYETFEIIRMKFSKFYNPSEHLSVDEVIVKLKGRYYSNSTSQKNANVSASKCSNCVTTGYTYDMNVKTDKGWHNT